MQKILLRGVCPKCGQVLRSEQRMRNHQARCLATGKWKHNDTAKKG